MFFIDNMLLSFNIQDLFDISVLPFSICLEVGADGMKAGDRNCF